MPGRLEDKVCVITGAASGIGAESARLFADEGARVVGVDLDEGAEGEFALVADVTDSDQVREMYDETRAKFGRIDVLFNNAGINPPDDLDVVDSDLEAWQRVQDVNVRGVLLCCKHGIPHLLDGGGGSVINMASFVALMGAATSQISYSASKGAVLSMSREMGVEFARRGVRVNALCPGPVDTPLLQELFAADRAQAERRLIHLPMGRFARGPRDRQRRPVPGERREQLRKRRDVHRRRRHLRRLRHPRLTHPTPTGSDPCHGSVNEIGVALLGVRSAAEVPKQPLAVQPRRTLAGKHRLVAAPRPLARFVAEVGLNWVASDVRRGDEQLLV